MTIEEKIVDQQGFEIIVGRGYQFIFAMPGPDVTLLKVKEIVNNEEIITHDLLFNFERVVKAKDLFRPVKKGWDNEQLKILKENGASEVIHDY